MTASPGGLTVEKQNSNGWRVYHESSGLPAGGPYLRLKRHAVDMRAELYATGVDFTQPKEAFRDGNQRQRVSDVLAKWNGLAARGYDPVTGDVYSPHPSYGQGCQRHGRATQCFGRWNNCLPYGTKRAEANRAHVRALLKERQPAYAAAIEAAVKVS
jgi:hypothetical protein